MLNHARWVVLCAAILPATQTWALQVDEFTNKNANTWPRTLSAVGAEKGVFNETLPGVLGGIRTSQLNLLKQDTPADTLTANVVTTTGDYLQLLDSTGASGSIMLQYGDIAGNPLNILYTGNALTLSFDSGDNPTHAPLTISARYRMFSNLALFVNPSLTMTLTDTGSGFHTVTLKPADIQPLIVGPFARIDDITLTLTGDRGADYGLHAITLSVPEPATAVIPALALMKLSRRRRVRS